MRIADQIAIVLHDCAALVKVCPHDDPEIVAILFEEAARRLAGVAAWLSGQAAMLRGPRCATCGGAGRIMDDETCVECGGTGVAPESAPERQESSSPEAQHEPGPGGASTAA